MQSAKMHKMFPPSLNFTGISQSNKFWRHFFFGKNENNNNANKVENSYFSKKVQPVSATGLHISSGTLDPFSVIALLHPHPAGECAAQFSTETKRKNKGSIGV